MAGPERPGPLHDEIVARELKMLGGRESAGEAGGPAPQQTSLQDPAPRGSLVPAPVQPDPMDDDIPF
jgi:hypothetical protein